MSRSRFYFPLLLTILVAGVVLGGFYERRGKTEIAASLRGDLDGAPLREQPAGERIFRQRGLRKVLTLPAPGETTLLYGPLTVKEGPHNEVFVLDSGDLSIKRFSSSGRFLTRYGKGKGQGPGEFVALTDFAVTEAGELWAVDPTNGRLMVFTPDGEVARTIRLDRPPYRLSLDRQGGFFLAFLPIQDRIFGRFDAGQKLVGSFGTFLTNQGVNAMALDGWVEPDGQGGFVYAGFYSGLLAGYDAQGRPRFYTEMLDRPPLPKMLRDAQGRSWVDREAQRAVTSLSVSPAGIHVLGLRRSGLKTYGSVDTYDLRDGSYRNSLKLPERCQKIVVTDRHLYTVQDTGLSKWEFLPGSAGRS